LIFSKFIINTIIELFKKSTINLFSTEIPNLSKFQYPMIFYSNALTLITILLTTSILTLSQAKSPDFILEIFTAGAHVPFSPAYDPENHWQENLDELTPLGMRDQFLAGVALHEKYPEIFNKYQSHLVAVKSVDSNKNLMSAFAHLQGVYYTTGPNIKDNIDLSTAIPPFNSDDVKRIANENQYRAALPGNTQAVPIYTTPYLEDHMFRSFQICAKAEQWNQENLQDDKAKSIWEQELKDLREYLSGKNIQINDWKSMKNLADTAFANQRHGYKLPGDMTEDSQYFKDLKFAYEYYFVQQLSAHKIQRKAYSKHLLNAILNYIDTRNKNAVFFSVNERTLAVLLGAFRILNTKCLVENHRAEKSGEPIPFENCVYPHYTNSFIFEVYRETEPKIAFLYNGKPISLCSTGEGLCKYKDFVNMVNPAEGGITIEEYNEVCNPGFEHHPDYMNYDRRYAPSVIITRAKKTGFTTLEVALIFFCSFASLVLIVQMVLKKGKQKKLDNQFKHKRLEYYDDDEPVRPY